MLESDKWYRKKVEQARRGWECQGGWLAVLNEVGCIGLIRKVIFEQGLECGEGVSHVVF